MVVATEWSKDIIIYKHSEVVQGLNKHWKPAFLSYDRISVWIYPHTKYTVKTDTSENKNKIFKGFMNALLSYSQNIKSQHSIL